MNNNIVPFNNAALGCSVRTVIINEEPWFVAKDVCDALEIGNSRQAVSYLDDDEKGVTTNDTLGGGWTEQTPYQLKNSKKRAPHFRDNKESQRM